MILWVYCTCNGSQTTLYRNLCLLNRVDCFFHLLQARRALIDKEKCFHFLYNKEIFKKRLI